MQKLVFIGFFILLIASFSSCKKEQCIDGDEYPRGAVREVPPFSAINVNLSAIVEIIEDTSHFVELIVEENLETHLSTNVINDTLNLSLGFCFSNHAEIKIRVHYDTLNTITISGPGDVVSKTLLTQDDLTLNLRSSGDMHLTTNIQNLVSNISGTGTININGEVDYHLINNTNSGSINSYQAITDSVIANISGTGNVYLRVKNSLTGNIQNSGSIYYKGFPNINENIIGTGSIINDN